MFKLSKKADYGLIAVKHLALHRNESHACSANEIAEEYGISTTLRAKVLQKLARNSLVAAKHGSTGGYQVPKNPYRPGGLGVNTATLAPRACVYIPAMWAPLVFFCGVKNETSAPSTPCGCGREPLRRVNESV